MRLRPSLAPADFVTVSPSGAPSAHGLPASVKRLLRVLRALVYSAGIAAVDRGYWSTLFRNIVTRILAFIVRGLRVRVEKIRVWKDGGSWEYKAEQFVLQGRAVGIFGSRYSLSVNELYVNVCKTAVSDVHLYAPVNASLELRRGVEIIAFLTPRFFTLLRPRRMAIMDDLRISVNVRDISCTAPRVLDASVSHIAVELTPGYSRGLRAKLPPSAPATTRPRKPSILRYWEGNGEVRGFAVRFTAPMASRLADRASTSTSMLPASVADSLSLKASQLRATQGSENGLFVRVESVEVVAYGKAADERHEAMARASINVRGCSAGSTAVDVLSHQLYETMTTNGEDPNKREGEHAPDGVESVENIDKIVAARPEALVWIEDVTAALDINCSKRHSMRIDIAGNGCIMAIEPVGLVILVEGLRDFISRYVSRRSRQLQLSSNMETESVASLARTSSGSSLQSADGEASTVRFVSDLRHWTAMVLGHGPVGDGDTMAIVLSSKSIVLPQIDFVGGSSVRIHGCMREFVLMHWSQWARTTNVMCKEAKFDIHRCIEKRKMISLKDTSIDWDLDVQSGLQSLPAILATLKQLKSSGRNLSSHEFEEDDFVVNVPQPSSREEPERIQLSETERRERREKRHKKLLKSLSNWEVSGSDISITASFPDGPKMGITVGELPSFSLSTETYVGRHVVLTMQDRKCVYGSEFRMDSPLHTMSRHVEKRKIEVEIHGLRLIMLNDFQFGYLLQDWLLRLRTVLRINREAKLRRRGIPVQKTRRRPLPDICFKSKDVEIYFEDHPLGGFLTRMLPLFQDETRERLVREQLMAVRIEQLHRIARAEIAGTAQRCVDALKTSDSKIWAERVRKLQAATPAKEIANGYLPPLEFAPAATFVAAFLSFSITMDDLVREHGSVESIRRLKMLDDYELGSKKHNKTRQHESDAWNSIGFRAVEFDAGGVRLRFRDYPVAFVVIDRMYFDKTMIGQAVQATLPPYVAKTDVGIGRRRVVKVVKGLGPTKIFADIHLVIDTLQCGYNPSFLGSIGDFGRGVSRFFGGGKNPSPKIPWFDSLRVSMHGRMRVTARKLKGHLTSSVSPYSMTKHYVDIEADNFEMLTSRLETSTEDPFPISWKLHNWHIRPSGFDKKFKSEIVFEFVRVGLNPIVTVLSGDAQDHYFVPFPSREDVSRGGPGIGRGSATLLFVEEPVYTKDNGFGNFTVWTTGLHEIPDFDSFKDFKIGSMILGTDICVKHAESNRSSVREGDLSATYYPPGTSVVHSDAISTLIKVVKMLVRRPISCRQAPRRTAKARKPPSKTGLSSTLVGLDVTVDAKDLNIMLYNNLEPGHGLFLSVASLSGELRKRTTIERLEGRKVKRTSKLTRRRFNIVDIYSSIRVPGLDMAVDANDTGKLLTVDKIALSDDLTEELKYMPSPSKRGLFSSKRGDHGRPASGFGSDDLDESPFYTFSATHPLQRGAKLDKVLYDKRLLVDRVRLIWSPVRRTSVFAWPDAFKEKSFAMKAPKVDFSEDQTEAASQTTILRSGEQKESTRDFTSETMLDELPNDDVDKISELDISEVQGQRNPSEGSKLTIEGRSEGVGNRQKEHITGEGVSITNPLSSPSTPSSNPDPLSPPLLSMSRSRVTTSRRPMGSMVDLLSPCEYVSSPGSQNSADNCNVEGLACGALDVLKTSPRFALFINDCQVAFGSPETSGTVFLTSNAVRVGIVDKAIQKNMQLGETNEKWSDREYRVHLNEANLYTRSKAFGEFDFSEKDWVPGKRRKSDPVALVTRRPICMDLMYVSSSSTPRDDGEEGQDDHILRPSLLFINIPDISMSTDADEFHAAIDVVRKVLMQSMRSSEVVDEELAKLRYKLQLAGGKVSSEELDDFMRKLNNVTKQFLYAGDTFQPHLVDALMLPGEKSFSDILLRYKAKAKAVATFMRQDQKASSTDVLYPTMYVSYSFDKCSWELREKYKELHRETEHPFVELTLDDLVCRHIFYVGRGTSTEMTFGNISAQNKIKSSYFKGILQPATTGTNRQKSRIKASDGAPVAFRWYSTHDDRVGGIPVYNLLTIQVAPMTAALTRKLWSSVSGFIFSTRSRADTEDTSSSSHTRNNQTLTRTTSRTSLSMSNPNFSSDSKTSAGQASGSVVAKLSSKMDDVSQMARRGESSMLFKYVFIDAFELTASYKNKENAARGVLDFFDLFVTTPSFSYSSQVWTWKAFSSQIRKDLVMTFARRGVSNLAKIKLLPGYSRARRKLVQGADSVRESLYSLVPTTGNAIDQSSQNSELAEDVPETHETQEAQGDEALNEGMPDRDNSSSGEEDEDRDGTIDAALADISTAEGKRRETVLEALYGESRIGGRSAREGRRHSGMGRPGSMPGSESSGESLSSRPRGGRGTRPPVAPSPHGAGTASTPSRGSLDEEHPAWPQAPRQSLFSRIRRKATAIKQDLKAEMEEAGLY